MDSEPVYLKDIPLEEAWDRLESALKEAGLAGRFAAEEVPLHKALGRTTAEPVWARRSSPHYHGAAMDGFALRSDDTRGASDRSPVELRVGAQAVYLDTGDPMPEWADAVIPIEHVEAVGETQDPRRPRSIRIRAAVVPWSHVRAMGEDFVASELILPSGHVLRPVDLGALASSGYERVAVTRRPKVAVLPTGTELVEPGTAPEPGQIVESNSLVLAAQVETWGGLGTRYPPIPDDPKALQENVRRAAGEHDLLLVIAGSSAGSEDYTARTVASLGRLLVHGIAVRPGHPVILGLIPRPSGARAEGASGWVVVIGVPGYPVSAALTGEIFVEPLLARWLGRAPRRASQIEAELTRKVHSSAGDVEYLRVVVGKVGARWVATPLSRGAGVMSSLVHADGLVVIPAGVQGYPAGTRVSVRLYRSLPEIERTVLAAGSHDLALDLMADHLARRGLRLASAHVGSLAGLIALQRGEAHVAGSHLLDPGTGEYNVSYVQRYLSGRPAALITLAHREQGLMVRRGNPLGIRDLEDLAREDVRFVNRQRGAGTRVLLDYHLTQRGIAADSIHGYQDEVYTHLAVAAAVASEKADCGLGVRAAADALGLDFLPVAQERYDLVIPRALIDSEPLAPLLELLHAEEFRKAVAALPGYDPREMGRLVAEIG